MQLPQKNTGYARRVHCGWYAIAQLQLVKHDVFAGDVEAVTNRLLEMGRKMDDIQRAVQVAISRRDAIKGMMEDAIRSFRFQLSARDLDAIRKPPFTFIFPKGLSFYTDTKLNVTTQRYSQFLARVAAALTSDDPLRQTVEDALAPMLQLYSDAVDQLSTARNDVALAKSNYDLVELEWDAHMEKLYGLLIAEFGKRAAERFFPRISKSNSSQKDETETPAESDKPDDTPPANPPTDAPPANADTPANPPAADAPSDNNTPATNSQPENIPTQAAS